MLGKVFNSLFPFASAGAYDAHIEQSFEEQGMSCLRYSSRTIFWTFPLFVDLTKTLLETFWACGFEEKSLRKLFILSACQKAALELLCLLQMQADKERSLFSDRKLILCDFVGARKLCN